MAYLTRNDLKRARLNVQRRVSGFLNVSDIERGSTLLAEFGHEFTGDLYGKDIFYGSRQAEMAAIEGARKAARALSEGQRRHEMDVLNLARFQSAEAIREGSVANVLAANRKEAVEEADEIYRLGVAQADQLQARADAEEANRERAEAASAWGLAGGIVGAFAGAYWGPAGAAAGYQIGSGAGQWTGAEYG